ncbi:DUF6745 domain-containing protein [Amycolatopsis sp. cg5]|uniref:DUF6745 domain-containing protein n=1 Tax=Amycolatopsis sp. cg5 TaxID=3238802 RepID=UPI0035256B58
MSAARRRISRLPGASEAWWRAAELRAEWLAHGLSRAPADRPAAESAITALYTLADRPPPEFAWVDSPAAAADVVPVSAALSVEGRWPLEGRLASLVVELRGRLDRRVRLPVEPRHLRPVEPPSDPLVALRSGVDLRVMLNVNVRRVLRTVLRSTIVDAVRAELTALPRFGWYGQFEADWVAYYDICHRVGVARFGAADIEQLGLWAAIVRSCGWWWPREDLCVLSERPVVLHAEPISDALNGEVSLHSETGPALVYRDGFGVHAWRGTRVPWWVIEDPIAERISAERNIEVRRCAIERIGWAEYIEQAGLALVSQASDPGNPGCELFLYKLPARQTGSSRLLLAVNGSVERDGTRRRYGLHVPAWFDDPVAAAGWSYGLSGAQYARLARRT